MMSLVFNINVRANVEEEAKGFARQLHQQGYEDKSSDITDMKKSFTQNEPPEELQQSFESKFDSGKKDEDSIKTYLDRKTVKTAQQKSPNQPSLGEMEEYAKKKHDFHFNENDPIFKKYQEISEGNLIEESGPSFFEKGQPLTQSAIAPTEQLFTCRQGVTPEYRSCTKRLVVKAIPQAPITKTVSAYFAAQCYNLVTFWINLKSGDISIHQCENPGPGRYVSVDNPLGEPDYPEKTTIKLLSREHIGEGGVDFRASGMNPSSANGFTASFTAFQPHTGRKKSHEGNKNRIRGAKYTWEVTMPVKPLLHKEWEGCEELERKALDNECELVEQEQHELNETKTIPELPPILEPYWSETKGYLCGGGRDINECEPFIKRQCEQVHSKCALFKNERCIEIENTFRCHTPQYQKTDGLSFHSGNLSFIPKDGNPVTDGYSMSDFTDAITHFSALTEMGKTLEDGLSGILGDPNNPSIFQGQCRQCRVNLGSMVRDCCRLKGLLQGLLGGCREEEKQLAVAAVKNKRCIKVGGRYCHKKKAGVCLEKRDSYCCYGSQLAKILQEIAHQQLGLSWGDAKNPQCAPLTADQLSRLNFDDPYAQQKLSEILADVQSTVQERFNRTQQAVSALKNLQVKTQEWEQNQAQKALQLQQKAQQNHERIKQGIKE